MDYFSKSVEQVEDELKTDVENGLKVEQIEEKRQKYGFNELQGKKKQSIFVKFLNQFKDFMIIVLLIAAVVSGIIGVKEGERHYRLDYHFNCSYCERNYWCGPRKQGRKIT